MAPVSLSRLFGSQKQKSEAEKVESVLVESLGSPLSLERKHMENKVLNIVKDEMDEMTTVLLRNYDTKNRKARESIQGLLKQIGSDDRGHAAIIDNISNPDQDVRKGVRMIIGDIWGEPAIPYATQYEQAVLLITTAKKKEIFVEDIITLAELSKVTFVEGDFLKAIEDITMCSDLIKHRYRAIETMKNYLSEMLRMTPELSRLGVQSGRIEESLRTAIKVSKTRTFDYTKELIEERMREMELADALRELGVMVRAKVQEKPRMALSDMNGMDVWAFNRLSELVSMSTSMTITGKRERSLEVIHSFLMDEFIPYLDDRARDRLEKGDRSILYTLYTTGLVTLKLSSELIPKVSEEMYISYYKEIEDEVSLAVVSWPEMVMNEMR